jgi:hypothetical protein
MKYYEFTCTPEEYDPQRVIRECVEDGRLWFILPCTIYGGNGVTIVMRGDIVPNFTSGSKGRQGWSDEAIPKGYYGWWFETLREAIDHGKSLKKRAPKKTYRVYYDGGK